jgi:hypothetical protein
MAANVNISGTQSGFCSESDISINPKNPSQIISASNTPTNQGQYWSIDGGASWKQTILQIISPDVNHTDPAVGWTTDGTAWAVVLGMRTTGLVTRVYKSSDGGGTWNLESTPSGSQTNTDRETFWVDRSPTSTFTDNMYIIWHNGGPCYVVARPGPGGSWGSPEQVSGGETTGSAVGADVKTNGNGDVLAFWPDTGSQGIYFAKSTNGGAAGSYSSPVKITTTFAAFKIPIPAQDLRQAAVYVSGGGYSGGGLNMVYACWTDLAGGSGCNSAGDAPGSNVNSPCKTRIWFSRSHDGGAHWDAPVKVNDQSSLNDQFFPRLAVDDATGNLMLVYYDTISDPGRIKTDLWMQCSTDNGNSWTNAVKITSGETDETENGEDTGNQYGDYIGFASFNGSYFACWTDRRSGGFEQIWGSAISIPFSYFIVDKNTFGVDEVNDNPSYANAFSVAVEGASPNSLGSAVPSLSGAFSTIPTISKSTSPLPFPTYADPSNKDTRQRIVFTYNTDFPSGANVPPFPTAVPPPDFLSYELDSAITFPGFTAQPLPASTLFELVAGEDPYFTNIDPNVDNPFYLSQDLRVFTLTPGLPGLNNVMSGPQAFTPTGGTSYTAQDPAAAYNYIQGLLNYLNNPANGYTNPQGTDPFSLFLDQGNFLTADSTVSPNSPNAGDPAHPWTNYNFAVARVRLIGKTGDSASSVKVFFRLFIAETFDTNYDTTNYYPFNADPAGLPGSPTPGPGNATYPFFATGDYSSATENSDYGTGGANNQNITVHATDSGGTWAYFGCFLNVYDSSIQGTVLAAGTHQCLVAQIAYDDAPIENSSTITYSPENSDKLAQRNLNIVFAASPHRIPSSFGTRPSPPIAPGSRGILGYPDELMISWGNTPRGSIASIYWPQVNATDVLELASKLYATNSLSASDPNTLQCPVAGDVTYIPIPPGAGSSFAGLFTVDLPSHVVKGQEFTITVRRLSTKRRKGDRGNSIRTQFAAAPAAVARGPIADWRYIVGTFQVKIPVSTKDIIVRPEENTLAILKWRLENMAPSNRWYPVLQRLVGIIAGRVHSLGGDPNLIPPSLTGYHPGPVHGVGKGREEFTGKVIAIIYDRFGDFEGFRLLTEEGHEMSFRGREPEVESLIYRAWEERILITVLVHSHERHWPASIIYRRPH